MDRSQEIAWLAGLFEGEGTVVFTGKYSVRLAISMKCKDVIERARDIAGVGTVVQSTTHPSSLWTWAIVERDAVIELITNLLPLMGVRRTARMEEALERLAKNNGVNKPVKHGTVKGYSAEKRRGLSPCPLCLKANSIYHQGLYQKRKLGA